MARTSKSLTVQELVRRWGGDPGSVELVRDSINTVYRYLDATAGRYLRISKFWAPEKMTAAADFLSCVSKGVAPVCAPVPSWRGRLVESDEIDGELHV